MIEQEIPKAKWGPGPWQDESDHIEWEHLGFPCMMHRAPMGNWCGYVAVPPGHPLHGITYHHCTQVPPCEETRKGNYCDHRPEFLLNVHGGLTYSDRCQGHICHVPKPGEPDDVWWFGFDCAHAFDLLPAATPLMKEIGHPHPHFLDGRAIYRDVPYVKNEVENLAQQLHDKNAIA